MSAFHNCGKIEAEGEKVFLDVVASRFPSVAAFPLKESAWMTEEHKEAVKDLQQRYGDYFVCHAAGPDFAAPAFVDLKVEQRFTGNFFVETWSNYPVNPGWLSKSKATGIVYVFLRPEPSVFLFGLPAMRRYVAQNRGTLKEVIQRQHEQNNETRGLLVPIEHATAAFRLMRARLDRWL